MKVRCKYSGIDFRVEHFGSFNYTDAHPVFNLSARELLVRSKDWGAQKFTTTENKLLFLALLNRTGCVEFASIANPSPRTVNRNIHQLFKLLGNSEVLRDETHIFARYRITEDNSSLDSVHNWISAWNENLRDWYNPISRHYLLKKSAVRELALDKLIHSPFKKTEEYAGKLAAWAMDNANVPPGLKDFWTSLFKLKENEIYAVRIVDLEELVEHMEFHLFATIGHLGITSHFGSAYADKVLDHVRGLLSKAKAGRMGELQNGKFFSILDDDFDAAGQTVNSTEKHNALLLACSAPEHEPKEADYPGKKLSFIRAKAAWNLAQNLQKRKV